MEILFFDNILCILGFLSSMLLWIKTYLDSRKKINLQIYDYKKYPHGVIQFFVYIQNNSSSPLTISDISIKSNDCLKQCELVSKTIKKNINCTIETPMFPINLNSKQGFNCFLEFLDCEQIALAPQKKVDFLICTNRGYLNKSLVLDNISHYLNTKK